LSIHSYFSPAVVVDSPAQSAESAESAEEDHFLSSQGPLTSTIYLNILEATFTLHAKQTKSIMHCKAYHDF
jgi:hypothetical protein